ncbi:hypothetical protein GGF37_002869, partial [Kickxella alabastrina]
DHYHSHYCSHYRSYNSGQLIKYEPASSEYDMFVCCRKWYHETPPKVSALDITLPRYKCAGVIFSNQLLGVYDKRLIFLKYNLMFAFPEGSSFDKVIAHNLTTLNLDCISVNYAWNQYFEGEYSGQIDFAKLRNFSLLCTWVEPVASGVPLAPIFLTTLSFSFPKLKYLDVKYPSHALRLLEAATFPPCLQHLGVIGTLAEIVAFDWTCFKKIGDLSVVVIQGISACLRRLIDESIAS